MNPHRPTPELMLLLLKLHSKCILSTVSCATYSHLWQKELLERALTLPFRGCALQVLVKFLVLRQSRVIFFYDCEVSSPVHASFCDRSPKNSSAYMYEQLQSEQFQRLLTLIPYLEELKPSPRGHRWFRCLIPFLFLLSPCSASSTKPFLLPFPNKNSCT